MYQKALEIIKKLQDNKFEAVFTGGCVRDKLLGVNSEDYDIATNAFPEEINKIFGNTKFVGENFGISLIDNIEVATYRIESCYKDGRHPENVELTRSMREDSNRRDFTINAMYWDPIADILYDFHNGEYDLNYKEIRFVGSAHERIKEDKLRMLRAFRFTSKLDFMLNANAWQAIEDFSNEISDIAQERVGKEINKAFIQTKRNNRKNYIYTLHISGLLHWLIPEINTLIGCEQPKEFHPEGDVFNHTLEVLSKLPDNANPELCWSAFLHDIGKPDTQEWSEEKNRFIFHAHHEIGSKIAREILSRFKYSNNFINIVSSLVENHMKFNNVRNMRKSRLRRFFSLPNYNWLLDLHKADVLGSDGDLSNYNFCLEKISEFENLGEEPKQLPKPLINGNDLIALGYIPSPIFKKMLDEAMDLQLEGNTREEILNYFPRASGKL